MATLAALLLLLPSCLAQRWLLMGGFNGVQGNTLDQVPHLLSKLF